MNPFMIGYAAGGLAIATIVIIALYNRIKKPRGGE